MNNLKYIFDSSVLKPYDIRGLVDKNITKETAYFVGKSYGTLLIREKNKHSCIVGFDGRLTSKEYADEVVRGLKETGINVINIGLVPTPMVYFGIFHLNVDAGVIITASHNPPEYNGFKFLTNEEPIFGNDIQKLGEYSKNGDFESGNGKVEYRDIKESYINFILKQLESDKLIKCDCPVSNLINKIVSIFKKPIKRKELNIVWDAGNGAMSVVMHEIIAKIPGKHTLICDTVDGTFPNHLADPSIEKYMEMLKEEVKKQNADLGIAFDGDGDRIGLVDSEGFYFFGDQTLDIIMRDFLKKNPGEKVIFELTSSQVLIDDIKKFGGVPVMWKPGHSSIKSKMKSDNIKIGGETSGHMYFGENHNFDDAFYAAIKLINFLSTSEKSLTELRKEFPKTYLTKKVKLKTPDDIVKYEIPKAIANRIREKDPNREIFEIDGARVYLDDGWWLIRSSNTEPCMTARCEARSEEGLEKCKAELKEQLAISGYNIDFE